MISPGAETGITVTLSRCAATWIFVPAYGIRPWIGRLQEVVQVLRAVLVGDRADEASVERQLFEAGHIAIPRVRVGPGRYF